MKSGPPAAQLPFLVLAACAACAILTGCDRTLNTVDHGSSQLGLPGQDQDVIREGKILDASNLPYQNVVTAMAEKWISSHGLPAVWCGVIRNGKLVALVAVGKSGVKADDKATISQHLNVGSVSKVVSNTLLSHFVATGQIKYSTTVGDVFTEFRSKYHTSPLLNASLAQLITHTAGLPRNVAQDFNMDGPSYRLDVVEKALRGSMGTPGTIEAYSNVGPVVAVAMVERVVGTSYESWLFGNLGKRIGLTDPRQVNSSVDEITPFYLDKSGSSVVGRVEIVSKRAFAPQGALSATLTDLCSFAIYTLNLKRQPLSPVGLGLLERYSGTGRTLGGWAAGTQYLFHNGDTGRGEYCEVSIRPKTDGAVVFYTNANSRNGDRFFMTQIGKDLDWLRYLD